MTSFGMRGRRIDAPTRGRLGDRLLSAVENVIYVSVAMLLSAAALVVVFRAFVELIRSAQVGQAQALLTVLDELLLVFIFAELLYAVRMTLKGRQVLVQPFLIAGILASIKEIIVLSVKAANNYISQGPEFARAMIGIGVLSAVVLVLAITAVLLRRGLAGPDDLPPAPVPPTAVTTPEPARGNGLDPVRTDGSPGEAVVLSAESAESAATGGS
ncbi:MAG: phosphate-starvation-inducible PsiE family protein [Dermatophilaceae bacterium]